MGLTRHAWSLVMAWCTGQKTETLAGKSNGEGMLSHDHARQDNGIVIDRLTQFALSLSSAFLGLFFAQGPGGTEAGHRCMGTNQVEAKSKTRQQDGMECML